MARRNGGTGANVEKNSAASPNADEKVTADETPSAGRGNVGQQIYAEVEELVAKEGITRSAAFARISEETGRQAGTVSANYYRVARQHGKGRGPRKRAEKATGTTSRGRGRRRRTPGTTVAIRDVQNALAALATGLRRQEAEIAKLRAENADLAQLQRMIKAQTTGSTRRRKG